MEIRQVLRQVGSRPLYASLLVGVLALGIGPTTALYSLVDAVLFRPLPVPQPETLVRLFRVDERGRPAGNLSFPLFEDIQNRIESFESVAAFSLGPFNVVVGSAPAARVMGAATTGDYFNVYSVPPLHGRLLLPDDDQVRGGHPVAVVSEGFWRNHMGGDPSAVGTIVRINNHPLEVVGVMPARFTTVVGGVEVWTPMAMMEQTIFQPWDVRSNRGRSWHDAVARLRPGASMDAAQAELDSLVASVVAETGGNPQFMRFGVFSASRAAIDPYGSRDTRRNAVLLLGLTVALMVIAVMNAASLTLMRAEERSREFALRMGLGAPRARVLKMLTAEASIYAAVSVSVGLFLAWATIRLGAPWLRDVLGWRTIDPMVLLHWRVIGFAVGVALVALLVAVAIPAIRVSSIDLHTAFKNGSPHERGGRAHVRTGSVVAQIALSVALLAVALLMVQSLWNTAAVEPGFDADGVVVADIDLMRQGYETEEAARFRDAVIARLDEHPSVERAAFTTNLPLGPNSMSSSFTVVGSDDGEFRNTRLNGASDGYFDVIRAPLLTGRLFTHRGAEDGPLEVVVSRAFAQSVFGDGDSVGRRLDMLMTEVEIVGVVGDIRLGSLRQPAEPVVWLPLSRSGYGQPHLVVRARSGDPWSVLPVIHDVVGSLDRAVPLFNTRTLIEHVGASYRDARALAYLLTAFAVLAVALAAAGLFGLLSWQVRTRTREIGIRVSLGATAARVRGHYLARAVLLTAIAVPAGLVAAVWTARAMERWLFGVTPLEATTYLTVAAGACALAAVAAWLPASRAAGVAPAVALRDE